MTQLLSRTNNPFSQTNGTVPAAPQTILGELCWWEYPAGHLVQLADIRQALIAEGLNPKMAGDFCNRWAFIRAIRKMEANKIVRQLRDENGELAFQFTGEYLNSQNRFDYKFEAEIVLVKKSGDIRCTDPVIKAFCEAEFVKCLEERHCGDLRQITLYLFDGGSREIYHAKKRSGVYFVPAQHTPFLDQVDRFVARIGGTMTRIPWFATPQAHAQVATIVNDAMVELLDEIEQHLGKITCESPKNTVAHAKASLEAAYNRLDRMATYLTAERTILHDRLGWLENLLKDNVSRPAPIQPEDDYEEEADASDDGQAEGGAFRFTF